MRFNALLALSFTAASCLLAGCAVEPPDSDDADQSVDGDDALSAANHWQSCSYGQVIDTFGGEAVKCDEANAHGVYQCVEYANRYMEQVKNKKHIPGNATDMCTGAKDVGGYDVYSPGGSWGHKSAGHKPVAGDLLVWSGGSEGYGHVAVVTSTSSSQVQYVQQNWGWFSGGHWGQVSHSYTSWSDSSDFFGQPGSSGSNNHPAKCWIHAAGSGDDSSSSSGGGGGRKSDCVTGGLYCGGDKLHGNADTLYECNADGSAKKIEACADGCVVRSGEDDACSPCVQGGLYCGGDKVEGNKNNLYRCNADGEGVKVKSCSKGCRVNSGSDDSCK